MSETEGTTPAPAGAPTSDESYVWAAGDVFAVRRPDWMSPEQWADLIRIVDQRFEELVNAALRSER